MITFEQFLWLIHYALLALYGWEIGFFAFYRIMQPDAFKQIDQRVVHRFWDAHASAALSLVIMHVVGYGVTINAVPIVLIVYAGVAIFCTGQNEAVKPLLLKGARAPDWAFSIKYLPYVCAAGVALIVIVALQNETAAPIAFLNALATFWLVKYLIGRVQKEASKYRKQSPSGEAEEGEDESDFTFDRDRFGGATPRGGNSSSYNAEADYLNALQEAQKWADQASSRENAERWAAKFEKLADNPALHAKDKLRYRLAAMLLRERLKGQEGTTASSSSIDPTDAEIARLGLPVPRN